MGNTIARILINTALTVIDKLVLGKIQYTPVQVLTASTFGNLRQVAVIVTDNDPDNSTQLKAYFQANKKKLAGESIVVLRALVEEEVDNLVAREILEGMLKEIEDALAA